MSSFSMAFAGSSPTTESAFDGAAGAAAGFGLVLVGQGCFPGSLEGVDLDITLVYRER